MKITDEIKQPEITKEKQDDIFFTLLNGKTLTEEIETSRGKFIVKYPKQKDLLYIGRRTAAMRCGIPADNFDENANFNLQKIAFLDVVIESGDAWFNNLKKNESFTWGDMPDTDFIDEVYVKAYSFRLKVQDQFRSSKEKADSGTADGKDVQDTMGNGLFQDVAGTAKRA